MKETPIVGEKPGRHAKVTVLIPTRGDMDWRFVYDLTQMMLHTTAQFVNVQLGDLGFIICDGTYVHRNRNDLAEAALKEGATHLLWLDDDMRFPSDLLVRLLMRAQPIVAVNYTRREIQGRPVTIKHIGDGTKPKELLYTEIGANNLEPVEGVGFGAVLMQATVFDKLEYPWFENYWDKKRRRWVGEDIDFCMKARKAKIPVLVDHELSQEIAHIGTFEYRMMHGLAVRDAAAAAAKEKSDGA